ncbi:MAG TPA: 6-pyruvoyl-tetrahydropterin synthase-related protein, partial [Terriglobales bacterium]|nr:6-pyruvoyl-tetrahydropterin synthase-related protein [Terriglobales bacterium]
MPPQLTTRISARAVAALVSFAVALAIVAPFFWLGNASGHDFEFHLRSWVDAAHSWRAGVWFPRWAELANYKFGEPRFIFYPPLSWMLGAALSFVLPWKMVPGAFCVLVLALAGVTMFTLARDYLPPTDAVLAGALYLANPYSLLVVYFRSAFAELLVAALLPLVVLYALRLPHMRWRAVAPLALVVGLVWLTNAPGAVTTTYALALLLAVLAWQERSAAPLVLGSVAIAIGLMLAAAYIIPAMVEQPWVRISEVLSAGLRVDENFLFTRIADLEHTRFNFIVSWVAVGEMAALALAGWAAFRGAALARARGPLATLGALSVVLMFRFTAPLWRLVPKAEFIQFPWRWLFVLGIVYALALAAALQDFRPRAFAYAG